MAICENCVSQVPIGMELKEDVNTIFENHTVVTPCPQCGGSLIVKDGTYSTLSYKVKYSKSVFS